MRLRFNMRLRCALIGVIAFTAMAQNASAKTWEKCFDSQADAYAFIEGAEKFSSTRVALKPLENEIFKTKSLDLDDLKNLFGEPQSKTPVGSVGDVILEWVPLKTRGLSVTDIRQKSSNYCTFISSRTTEHLLRATVDTSGKIVYRETRKKQIND